jgi:hypothetical protein
MATSPLLVTIKIRREYREGSPFRFARESFEGFSASGAEDLQSHRSAPYVSMTAADATGAAATDVEGAETTSGRRVSEQTKRRVDAQIRRCGESQDSLR